MRDTPIPSQEETTVVRAVAQAVEGRAGVAAAYVYGSAARNRRTPLSDLDVALLYSSDGPEGMDRRRVASQVAAAVSRRLGGTVVDLRDAEALPLAVQGEIVTRGIRAASAEDVRRVRFEARVRQLYLDFLPFREATTRPALEALRKRYSDG